MNLIIEYFEELKVKATMRFGSFTAEIGDDFDERINTPLRIIAELDFPELCNYDDFCMIEDAAYAIWSENTSTSFVAKVVSYEGGYDGGVICMQFSLDIFQIPVYTDNRFCSLLGKFVKVTVPRVVIYPDWGLTELQYLGRF